jgi:polyisoprenoid-binding protein YceI
MTTRTLRFLFASLLSFGLVLGLTATATAQDSAKKGAETLKVDPVHSNVLFRIKHFNTGYVFGEFLGEKGTIKFDPDNPEKMKVELTVPVESISTDNDKRDKHLKSPDFFSAKQFPNITFKSKEVEKKGKNKFEVTGDLTIHGQTEEVSTVVEQVGSGKDPQGNFRRGFYTEFDIDRTDFGMDFMSGALSDDVKLIIAVEAVRQ